MVHQSKKIFVIDDDVSIGEILSMMLEMEGYTVNSFNSGKSGVARAHAEKPDIVLLDYFLPGERAENIIKNLRKAVGKDMPILLMSASRQAEEKAEELAVNEFIAKPFHREKLLESIARNIN